VVTGRRKALAVIASVFLLGAIFGAGASWALFQREVRALAAGERPAWEHRRLDALSGQLDLTSEQRERLAEIFARNKTSRDQVMRDAFEQCEPIRAHREKLTAEIHSVLGPEQRARYDELVREHGRPPFGLPAVRKQR
jgi:hypothetical protein